MTTTTWVVVLVVVLAAGIAIGVVIAQTIRSSRSPGQPPFPDPGMPRGFPPPLQAPSLTSRAALLTPGDRQTIVELLRGGTKIVAIKHYRQCTGVGLAEAKAAVEAIERSG